MQNHTVIGHRMLSAGRHPTMQLAASIALSHHECWDGSGYPYRLAGCAIPIGARIVAVADSYDALRMERSYKPGLSHQDAVDIMLKGDERTKPAHFDPLVLTTLPQSARKHADGLRDLSRLVAKAPGRSPPTRRRSSWAWARSQRRESDFDFVSWSGSWSGAWRGQARSTAFTTGR